jgi:hypothetical protein
VREAAEEEPPPAPALLLVALAVVVPVHRVTGERGAGRDERGLDVDLRIQRPVPAVTNAVLGVPRRHGLGHSAAQPPQPPLKQPAQAEGTTN